MVCFWCVIVCANVKVWIMSKTFKIYQLFILIVSVLLYPLMYWGYSLYSSVDVYGFYEKSFSFSKSFILCCIVTCGACNLVDWAVEKRGSKYYHYFFLKLIDFIFDMQLNKEIKDIIKNSGNLESKEDSYDVE